MQRLRERFGRRGAVTSSAVLAGVLLSQGAQSAPLGLAASITQVCAGKAAASTAAAATTNAILKSMLLGKLKAAAAGSGVAGGSQRPGRVRGNSRVTFSAPAPAPVVPQQQQQVRRRRLQLQRKRSWMTVRNFQNSTLKTESRCRSGSGRIVPGPARPGIAPVSPGSTSHIRVTRAYGSATTRRGSLPINRARCSNLTTGWTTRFLRSVLTSGIARRT